MGRLIGRLQDRMIRHATQRVRTEVCEVVSWDPVGRTYTVTYEGQTMAGVPALGLPVIASPGASARLQLQGNSPVGILPL